jgi:hypothetical protein
MFMVCHENCDTMRRRLGALLMMIMDFKRITFIAGVWVKDNSIFVYDSPLKSWCLRKSRVNYSVLR